MLTLYRKEIKSFFRSSGTWIILAYASLMQGISMSIGIQALNQLKLDQHLLYFTFHTPIFWFFYLFLFPLLTMKIFAGEEKTKTLELLIATPLRIHYIVISKYLAILTSYIILWIPSIITLLLIQRLNTSPIFDLNILLSNYGILFIMGSFYLSIGIFCSALSSNIINAGIINIGILIPLLFSGYIPNIWGEFPIAELFRYIAPQYHIYYFSQGSINSSSIIYYLSGTLLLLYLTKILIQKRIKTNSYI